MYKYIYTPEKPLYLPVNSAKSCLFLGIDIGK